MRVFHFLKYYLQDLRKQKKRATLTILAVVWGTFSILMLLAFGEGLRKQLNKARHGLGHNIIIVWGGQTSISYQGLPRGRRIWLRPEDVGLLKRHIPEIKLAGGEYHRWGVDITYKEHILSQHVTGVPPEWETLRTHYPERGGRFINKIDMETRRRVVFLGYELKQKLFGDEDPVGQQIQLRGLPFTVIGFGQDKMQMGMYSGPDVEIASIPATTFKAIFGDPYLDDMVLEPRTIDQTEYVKRRIHEILGAKYKFDPDDEDALSMWDVASGSKQFNNIMLGIQTFLGIVGGLTLLFAGVGVANIMYVVVKERTREIGIKMATGAKRRHILNQFLLEGLLVCFTGGVGGILISFVACYLLGLIPLGTGDDPMNWLGRPTISTTIGLIVAALLTIVGLFSGLFPARKAAATNPVESLRYE
jgi:putative ABC transport system permease protein